MKLHLGVVDVPYVGYEAPSARDRRLRRGGKPPAGAKTTGDVATILEAKYGVMGTFFDLHGREIAGALERGVKNAVESILAGAPSTVDPFADGTQRIKTMFNRFLTDKEMDRAGIPGVPTEAAQKGVSHRFKRRRSEPDRPSFVDTGLYEASFRSWVDR